MDAKDDFSFQSRYSPNEKFETFSTPKVHVNPNFKNVGNLVIHVNPRMQKKPMIHVNPLMMKNILPNVSTREISDDPVVLTTPNVESRIGRTNNDDKSTQKSIHVNPKLMEKLSSIARADIEATTKNSKPIAIVDVTRKINKPKDACEIVRKNVTPRKLLTISRRKLVRIPANTITTFLNASEVFNPTKSSVAIVSTRKSGNSNNNTKFDANKHKHKLGTYKIDRTKVELNKRKKVRVPEVVTVRSVNKGLVAIGGVMYQSSRTRLVRSSSGPSVYKKRRSAGGTRGETFVVAKNGKKLRRLSIGNNVSRYSLSRTSPKRCSLVKRVPNSIINSSHKNVISYKAKQRSLQILRDKHRKNYIPCLIFRRFGYCANHEKGTCSKLHDKKQVALCRNFLQGKCLLDQCPMSHDIGPEKMPTCKYFLEGCCIRDACPYLHVKVSPKTPLCAQFLRGYCAEGSKCKQRHAFVCPAFDKGEECRKGKHCPYPHKLKSVASVSKTSVRRNPEIARKLQSKREPTAKSAVESRKRYYDKACPSDEQLADMRKNLLRQMELIKAKSSGTSDNFADETIVHDDEADGNNRARPKRPPIGPLPAYIPIN